MKKFEFGLRKKPSEEEGTSECFESITIEPTRCSCTSDSKGSVSVSSTGSSIQVSCQRSLARIKHQQAILKYVTASKLQKLRTTKSQRKRKLQELISDTKRLCDNLTVADVLLTTQEDLPDPACCWNCSIF